jgi:hypothetical protein
VRPRLGRAAIGLIEKAVDTLFERIRQHVLGEKPPIKRLYIGYKPHLTLKGIFDLASTEEGVNPDQDTLRTLLKISNSYLDATKEKTKARVVQSVQSFLTDAHNQGVRTDVKTVLEGQLYEVMGDTTKDLKRILETESTVVRNVGIMDGILKANAAAGIDDPTVFFVTVRDQSRCEECTRLHVQPDKTTPRVWKMSELGSSYHKKGDSSPKIGGLHPHCRCVLTTLMPGYGFSSSGLVQYKNPGYDEFKVQRGLP